MISPSRASVGTTYVSEKRISQWEGLMKKFSEAHKEKCKTVSPDIPRVTRSVKEFPTGSQYDGTWDVLGMSGYGEYIFPNGLVYVGDIEDGMFHGKGELRYENGCIIRGKWNKGVMTDRKLLFSKNLEYHEDGWKYCHEADRRFAIEFERGLNPAGKSYLTADQPTREIPYGYYDTGDGFYEPKTQVVYKYHDLSSIQRFPTKLEQKWIEDNCRQNPQEPLGPRPELYEQWAEPQLKLPEPPPPSAGAKCSPNVSRQHSVYEQEFALDPVGTNFYDASKYKSAPDRSFGTPRPINVQVDSSAIPSPPKMNTIMTKHHDHMDDKTLAHLCITLQNN